MTVELKWWQDNRADLSFLSPEDTLKLKQLPITTADIRKDFFSQGKKEEFSSAVRDTCQFTQKEANAIADAMFSAMQNDTYLVESLQKEEDVRTGMLRIGERTASLEGKIEFLSTEVSQLNSLRANQGTSKLATADQLIGLQNELFEQKQMINQLKVDLSKEIHTLKYSVDTVLSTMNVLLAQIRGEQEAEKMKRLAEEEYKREMERQEEAKRQEELDAIRKMEEEKERELEEQRMAEYRKTEAYRKEMEEKMRIEQAEESKKKQKEDRVLLMLMKEAEWRYTLLDEFAKRVQLISINDNNLSFTATTAKLTSFAPSLIFLNFFPSHSPLLVLPSAISNSAFTTFVHSLSPSQFLQTNVVPRKSSFINPLKSDRPGADLVANSDSPISAAQFSLSQDEFFLSQRGGGIWLCEFKGTEGTLAFQCAFGVIDAAKLGDIVKNNERETKAALRNENPGLFVPNEFDSHNKAKDKQKGSKDDEEDADSDASTFSIDSNQSYRYERMPSPTLSFAPVTSPPSIQQGDNFVQKDYGCGYNSSQGHVMHRNKKTSGNDAFKGGDVIGIEVDMNEGVLLFLKNGKPQPVVVSGLPAKIAFTARCNQENAKIELVSLRRLTKSHAKDLEDRAIHIRWD
ncbi:hypothetical protein BLNAU_5681 [Blattamonas nauphoetae]|uniref:SPRY domain-containing protein n=1 Tax=Blattamonas nauphoetae TaxID=2049346 RepID=A0ABQ9Y6I2_9EUKA|nr:hypothetical protein BLNAU_5681 [Blattamonas nauphoetae]